MATSYDIETLPEKLDEHSLDQIVAAIVTRFGVDEVVEELGQYLAYNVKNWSNLTTATDSVVRKGQRQRSDILLAVAKVLRAL